MEKSLEPAEQEAIDKVLKDWNWAKDEQAAMLKKIEQCKTQVDSTMKKLGVTELLTANFKVDKRTQSREGVSKKDMPDNVWSQYAKTSAFTVLSFTALTGKRSAAAKSKAKAQAKAAAGGKAKPTKK